MEERIVESKFQNDNTIKLKEEEKQLNMFRTLYYQLNAKPDSLSKVYAQNILVSNQDIYELNEQIKDKIRMHCEEDDGYIATVTVELESRKVINFECWEEYLNHVWTDSECVRSIVIKWNFNVKMPQYQYPQNHSLLVRISSGLRPEELLNLIISGKIEDMGELNTNAFPVYARVDFVETRLGEELLNIVSEWINGLRQSRRHHNKYIMILRKYRKKVAQYFNYVTTLIAILFLTGIFDYVIKSMDIKYISEVTINEFLIIFNMLVGGIVVMFILYSFFTYVAKKVYDKLESYGYGFVFDITKGDNKRQGQILEDNKRTGRSIVRDLIASIVINLVCAIITAIII